MSFHLKLEKDDNSSFENFFFLLERINFFSFANPEQYFPLSNSSPTFQYNFLTILAQYLLFI